MQSPVSQNICIYYNRGNLRERNSMPFIGFPNLFLMLRASSGQFLPCWRRTVVTFYFKLFCAFPCIIIIIPRGRLNSFGYSRHSTWCRPIEGIDYNIIWGLRNIAARGSDLGRSALDKALTPEGTDLLKMLRDSPSGWQEEWMAQEAKVRISEILGGEMSETDFVHIYQHHTLPMLSE